MTDDVLSGELLVRFDASVADLLDQAGLTKAASTKSGVTSVDEVLSILEGCTLERVLPQIAVLRGLGADVIPIMSEASISGMSSGFRRKLQLKKLLQGFPLLEKSAVSSTTGQSGRLSINRQSLLHVRMSQL